MKSELADLLDECATTIIGRANSMRRSGCSSESVDCILNVAKRAGKEAARQRALDKLIAKVIYRKSATRKDSDLVKMAERIATDIMTDAFGIETHRIAFMKGTWPDDKPDGGRGKACMVDCILKHLREAC